MSHLTVAEAAGLVGRSTAFVRQHVRRGHLHAERHGSRVYIERGEFLRWVRERELGIEDQALQQLELTRRPSAQTSERMARIRILAVRDEDGTYHNLLTTIRRRRGSANGSIQLRPHSFGDEVLFAGGDVDSDDADALVHQASRGHVTFADHTIRYSLRDRRKHFAGRGQPGKELVPDPVTSPFGGHSALVDEHWSDPPPGGELVERVLEKLPKANLRLMFPLERYRDRAGNLLVFDALDEIETNLTPEGGAVRLTSDFGPDACPEGYTAALTLYLEDDIVVRDTFPITGPSQLRRYDTDWGAYRLTIYRNRDGQCVDDVAHFMLREVRFNLDLAGPALSLRDPKGKEIRRVRQSSRGVESRVNFEGQPTTIRNRQLARRAHNKEQEARAEHRLLRCGPDELETARQHFAELVAEASKDGGVLYIADPYFFQHPFSDPHMFHLWCDLIEKQRASAIRILHGFSEVPKSWRELSPGLRRNVVGRAVCRQNGSKTKPGFHDRFIASQSTEFLMTHSVTGWASGGVTFVRIPGEVYFSIAEELWSRSSSAEWLVEDTW